MTTDQQKIAHRRTTTLTIIVVMLLWASCFPLITTGIEFSPHLTFAALRAVLAGSVLTILAIALGRPLPKSARLWVTLAFVGFGATSLGFLGMFHAAEFITPGIATVIANTQPLMAAGLAAIFLQERLSKWGRIGLGLGFMGSLIIASPQLFSDNGESYALGIAYIVLAVIGVTVSNVMIKRITGTVDAFMAMGLQILIGSVPLAIGAWYYEDPTAVQWTPTFVTSLLGLSLLGTALAYYLWFSVLEKTPLNQANAFAFLVPIFGISLGVMFFDETLGWAQIIGIPLTIFGVGLVTRE